MEQLTLDNFESKITKTISNKAKKLLVRDLEEISANKLAAYVDEGTDSFDVSITFNKTLITNLTCDCENGASLCVHKNAFLYFLKNRKQTPKNTVRKKQTETDILIEQISHQDLKQWFSELLKKNKDIEFLFVNNFSKKEIIFTKVEAKASIESTIKSVIKNKRTIDGTELKKVIDLLDITLKPFVVYCQKNIEKKESTDLILFINTELIDFHHKMYLSSIKIIRFVERIYKEINLYIHNIKDHEVWQKIIDYRIDSYFNAKSYFDFEMNNMFHLYESMHSKEQKEYFAEKILAIFNKSILKKTNYIATIQGFILKILAENGLFEDIYEHFQAKYYENDYNILLLEKLIEIKKYDVAEDIAKEQIFRNSNDKYNTGYFNILKEIYKQTENSQKNALISMKTIFYNFEMDDYFEIQKHSSPEAFKVFRTKVLGYLKRNFHGNSKFVKAYIDIYFLEKNYQKILENISLYTTYSILFEYRKELYTHHKSAFLVALTLIEGTLSRYANPLDEMEMEYRNKFLKWIDENYSFLEIKATVQVRKRHYDSNFLDALNDLLENKNER
jgi:hypothetical protein